MERSWIYAMCFLQDDKQLCRANGLDAHARIRNNQVAIKNLPSVVGEVLHQTIFVLIF